MNGAMAGSIIQRLKPRLNGGWGRSSHLDTTCCHARMKPRLRNRVSPEWGSEICVYSEISLACRVKWMFGPLKNLVQNWGGSGHLDTTGCHPRMKLGIQNRVSPEWESELCLYPEISHAMWGQVDFQAAKKPMQNYLSPNRWAYHFIRAARELPRVTGSGMGENRCRFEMP